MATNYPTSLDDGTSLPEPSTGAVIPALADTNRSQAIKALQAKLGIGASAASGANLNDILVNDGSGGSAWTAPNELVQDIVGAMFSGNTETLISATYQDADGTIDLVVDQASIDHGSIAGLADDDHTQYAIISSGTGAPSSTPVRVGAIYVNTANGDVYVASGSSSSADWEHINAGGGGGTVDVVSNVATNTILGRVTAGSGDSEELTPTQVRTLINVEDGADVTDSANVTTALGSISVDAHSDVDLDKSKTPADGDVLTFDGTHWNAETPTGGGGGGSNPYGANVVIAASGGDYTTLGAYFAATPTAGDIIYLEPGTYQETSAVLWTTNNISIYGSNRETTILEFNSASNNDIQTNNLVISGVQIQQTGNGRVKFSGTYPHIYNSKWVSNLATSLAFWASGIGANVHDNIFDITGQSSGAGDHIFIQGQRSKFNDNTVLMTYIPATGDAPLTIGGLHSTCHNNLLNVATPNTAGATIKINTSNISVNNNTIVHGASSAGVGIFTSQSVNRITNNHIENALISIDMTGTNNTVASNVIETNLANSIGIRSALGNTMTGNTIKGDGATDTGIYINGGADNCVITGNQIINYATGLNIPFSTIDNTVNVANSYYNCTTDVADSGTGTITANNAS